MTANLATLRETPQPTPARFLSWQPGCWVQYYDDTPARDPARALSARRFDPEVARRKQADKCAVSYSLQAFERSRTKEGLISFRNLGVDVDLVTASERATITTEEIDRRKEEYLQRVLLPFPLKPHWLTETRHGLHAVFRVMPMRWEADVTRAMAVNRDLVRAIRGDENAVLLTQVLRVPGTLQFKGAGSPFPCRLLLDNSSVIHPYPLATVRGVLDGREVFRVRAAVKGKVPGDRAQARKWQAGLDGTSEGERNATAASVVGAIVALLPRQLWEVAGWGGLREWNRRNAVPLPEPELRGVFLSIARRELNRRTRPRRGRPAQVPSSSASV